MPHSTREIPPILYKLRQQLVENGEHIILGDFNLHHPLWNHPTYKPHHHYLAEELLDIVTSIGATLKTPQGLATRDCQRGIHHERTTIDLLFSTLKGITPPSIAREIEQSSDHLPIETSFQIENPAILAQDRAKRLWKNLDIEVFLSVFDLEASILENLSLDSRESIDYYITLLVKAIEKAIDLAVPLKKGSPYDKEFWTKECTEAVQQTRALRRLYTRNPTSQNWNNFTKQRNTKGKTLSKAKKRFFRKRIEELSAETTWQPYKWAKKRQKGPTALSIPSLRVGDYTATTLQDKASLLREQAFKNPLPADLRDTFNYRYPKPLSTDETVTLEEVQAACLRTRPDKAPGPDGIPNRVIHLLARQRITLL
jgi:Endonuclease-reverse transcriptase